MALTCEVLRAERVEFEESLEEGRRGLLDRVKCFFFRSDKRPRLDSIFKRINNVCYKFCIIEQ